MSTLSFNELEAKVEGALLSSDLTLSRIKLTLMNFSAQLTAIRAYLKDLRADDVGQVLSPTERSALLNEALKEEQRVERLSELATQVRDELRKTQLRVGLYDEAFALDEALRTELYEALSAESGLFFERISRKPPRKGKKQVEPRTVDLAPGIHSVRWRSELPRDAEGLITVSDDERILELRLTLQGPEMVRPEEVLWLLFGGRIPPAAQVIRRRLLPAPDKVEAGREVRT